jgi:glycosyltransferase involved in cell wall biosynthesis
MNLAPKRFRVPLVSVVIPTFNRAAFIAEAIDSVLEQNFPSFEILVVDDRSTDRTVQVIKRLMQRHPEIFLLENKRRKGPSGARNTGILAATGEFVAFLDSDDTWLPNHLEKGVLFLEGHKEVTVLFGNFRVEDVTGCDTRHDFFDRKRVLHQIKKDMVNAHFAILCGNVFHALIQENFFHVGTSIIRSDVARKVLFDEHIRLSEDRDFAIRLSKIEGAVFGCRFEPTFIQRRHGTNLSDFSDTDNLLEAQNAHVYLFRRYLKELSLSRFERRALTLALRQRLLSIAYRHRQKREIGMAMASVCQSLYYGLNGRQITEFAKIVFSALSATVSKRAASL